MGQPSRSRQGIGTLCLLQPGDPQQAAAEPVFRTSVILQAEPSVVSAVPIIPIP
jgi:hypothetical protein